VVIKLAFAIHSSFESEGAGAQTWKSDGGPDGCITPLGRNIHKLAQMVFCPLAGPLSLFIQIMTKMAWYNGYPKRLGGEPFTWQIVQLQGAKRPRRGKMSKGRSVKVAKRPQIDGIYFVNTRALNRLND